MIDIVVTIVAITIGLFLSAFGLAMLITADERKDLIAGYITFVVGLVLLVHMFSTHIMEII